MASPNYSSIYLPSLPCHYPFDQATIISMDTQTSSSPFLTTPLLPDLCPTPAVQATRSGSWRTYRAQRAFQAVKVDLDEDSGWEAGRDGRRWMRFGMLVVRAGLMLMMM